MTTGYRGDVPNGPAQHLAQVNIALLRAPLDSPQLQDFVDLLEPINRLADRSAGFIWRLQTDDGDATALRFFGDDRCLVNMSVWRSLEALAAFVYRSSHTDVMRRRREWFARMAQSYLALWWIPAGHVPTVPEAEARVTQLRIHGPSPDAFTFKAPFPPHEGPPALIGNEVPWECPAG